MGKKKPKSWEEYYKLPIKYNYSYGYCKNDTMALTFNHDLSDEDCEKIVDVINGNSEMKINGLAHIGTNFYQDGEYIFCVRGWGGLIGIGALNMSEEEALKIQDGFIEYVFNKLK
jgi:hypothetical protein